MGCCTTRWGRWVSGVLEMTVAVGAAGTLFSAARKLALAWACCAGSNSGFLGGFTFKPRLKSRVLEASLLGEFADCPCVDFGMLCWTCRKLCTPFCLHKFQVNVLKAFIKILMRFIIITETKFTCRPTDLFIFIGTLGLLCDSFFLSSEYRLSTISKSLTCFVRALHLSLVASWDFSDATICSLNFPISPRIVIVSTIFCISSSSNSCKKRKLYKIQVCNNRIILIYRLTSWVNFFSFPWTSLSKNLLTFSSFANLCRSSGKHICLGLTSESIFNFFSLTCSSSSSWERLSFDTWQSSLAFNFISHFSWESVESFLTSLFKTSFSPSSFGSVALFCSNCWASATGSQKL